MPDLITSLSAIRAKHPCEGGWQRLLAHLHKTQADDLPLAFETILTSSGLSDALWCTQTAPQYAREWRLFGVWCVRQIQDQLADPHSLSAIDTAERFANGEGVRLAMAREAAQSVARACRTNATWAAAYVTNNAAHKAAIWASYYAACATAYKDNRGPFTRDYYKKLDANWQSIRALQAARFRLVCRGKV